MRRLAALFLLISGLTILFLTGCKTKPPESHSLLAGDAFTTQSGVVAAGVLKLYFPFPCVFSWNRELAAESARKLRNLKPARLAVGRWTEPSNWPSGNAGKC
jgi:hypothetical protein